MRLQHVQTNFTAGEISGRLYGRSDLDRYQNALRECTNAVVQQHGGVTRRPGTVFVARARGNADPRLIEFQYSTEQAYVIEFTNTNCRFYRDKGQIQYSNVAGGIEPLVTNASWSSSTATMTTAVSHKFAIGDLITLTLVDSVWGSVVNGNQYLVTAVTSTTFDFELASNPGTYTNDPADKVDGPYTITSPYSNSDLPDLTYTQSADILYVCHKDYEPRELQRVGVDEFQFATVTHNDGPYLGLNTTQANTITPVTGTGSKNFTLSGTSFITASNIGQQIRWRQSDAEKWGWGEITNVSGTTLTVDVQYDALSSYSASYHWRLGAWHDTEGYPQACAFHQQRLWFANTPGSPQTAWASETDNYDAWRPSLRDNGSVLDTNGLTYTISDDQVNDIRWMISSPSGLLIGTGGAEFLMTSRSSSDALTPTNVGVFRQTACGSRGFIRPRFINGSTLFVQRSGRKVRELSYRLDNDQHNSADLTLLAEHITLDIIKRTAYQQEPNSILWACDEDGGLLSMTYEREENVIGWAKHALGGINAKVNDLCCIFDDVDGVDRLWMVVERTINGSTVRFIEYLGEQFGIDRSVLKAGFVDSCLVYDGSATTTITGLLYLEGETLQVLANGAAHPDVVVTNGSITLQYEATDVQVGYGYTTRIKTLPIYTVRAPFETRGRVSNVYKVKPYFYRTVGCEIGSSDTDDLEIVPFRNGGQSMDTAVKPYTGFKEVGIDDYHDEEASIIIEQNQPLPMTILSITYLLDVNDV